MSQCKRGKPHSHQREGCCACLGSSPPHLHRNTASGAPGYHLKTVVDGFDAGDAEGQALGNLPQIIGRNPALQPQHPLRIPAADSPQLQVARLVQALLHRFMNAGPRRGKVTANSGVKSAYHDSGRLFSVKDKRSRCFRQKTLIGNKEIMQAMCQSPEATFPCGNLGSGLECGGTTPLWIERQSPNPKRSLATALQSEPLPRSGLLQHKSGRNTLD